MGEHALEVKSRWPTRGMVERISYISSGRSLAFTPFKCLRFVQITIFVWFHIQTIAAHLLPTLPSPSVPPPRRARPRTAPCGSTSACRPQWRNWNENLKEPDKYMEYLISTKNFHLKFNFVHKFSKRSFQFSNFSIRFNLIHYPMWLAMLACAVTSGQS